MTLDAPVADSSASSWLEDHYLDALSLYREIAAAGSDGQTRGQLKSGERWDEALDLLLASGLVIEVPAPRARNARGNRPGTVLRATHVAPVRAVPVRPA